MRKSNSSNPFGMELDFQHLHWPVPLRACGYALIYRVSEWVQRLCTDLLIISLCDAGASLLASIKVVGSIPAVFCYQKIFGPGNDNQNSSVRGAFASNK